MTFTPDQIVEIGVEALICVLAQWGITASSSRWLGWLTSMSSDRRKLLVSAVLALIAGVAAATRSHDWNGVLQQAATVWVVGQAAYQARKVALPQTAPPAGGQ